MHFAQHPFWIPYLYEDDGIRFILGKSLTGADANPRSRDLPRSRPQSGARRAIIGDPRNDENVIVSQFQGLMHRFHNAVATDYSDWTFAQVQREVCFHYQWVVVNDLLTTLVAKDVSNAIAPHIEKKTDVMTDPPNIRFFHFRDEP